jgi:probable HAF family extracellular repeat protein
MIANRERQHYGAEPSTSRSLAACLSVLSAVAMLALPVVCIGQIPNQKLPQYTVLDLGTLGGTFSGVMDDAPNQRGQADGFSTLPGDNATHAFLWTAGNMTDLGTLGGTNSRADWQLNDWGAVPAVSETTTIDPYDENYCFFGTDYICRAFVWFQGVRHTLPTLGGNNTYGAQINNLGQMVGASEIPTPNPTCPPPQYFIERPVLWEGTQIRELPIFPGDTSGAAFVINDLGEVSGYSSPDCSTNVWHAWLYKDGKLIYFGSLGGQSLNIPQAINNKMQVVGGSDLAGDTVNHAFLWENGVLTDLGSLPEYADSIALGINDRGQVVGGVSQEPFLGGNTRAFLWQDGVMTDLNSLVVSDSPLFLLYATGINSRGQILGQAVNVNTGELHAFLATPVDKDNSGRMSLVSIGTKASPSITLPDNVRPLLQQRVRLGRFGAVVR